MNGYTLLLTAVLSPALSATGASASIVLDDFDSIPNDEAGGPRTITFDPNSNNPLGVTAIAEVRTDLGAFVFDTGPEAAPDARISWDNDGAGLNLDASALGLTGLEFDFGFVDQDFTFLVQLVDGDNRALRLETRISASPEFQTYAFDFSDFESGATFDATDVDRLQIYMNGTSRVFERTRALDFTLTELRAVPAPASLALLGIGGLAARRKR